MGTQYGELHISGQWDDGLAQWELNMWGTDLPDFL